MGIANGIEFPFRRKMSGTPAKRNFFMTGMRQPDTGRAPQCHWCVMLHKKIEASLRSRVTRESWPPDRRTHHQRDQGSPAIERDVRVAPVKATRGRAQGGSSPRKRRGLPSEGLTRPSTTVPWQIRSDASARGTAQRSSCVDALRLNIYRDVEALARWEAREDASRSWHHSTRAMHRRRAARVDRSSRNRKALAADVNCGTPAAGEPNAIGRDDGLPHRHRRLKPTWTTWYFLATHSSGIDVADRVIGHVTAYFALLARELYIRRRHDDDLRRVVRRFPVGDCVIDYRVDGTMY